MIIDEKFPFQFENQFEGGLVFEIDLDGLVKLFEIMVHILYSKLDVWRRFRTRERVCRTISKLPEQSTENSLA